MIKTTLLFTFLLTNIFCHSQEDKKISTIDFVEIINDNRAETIYFYQNNWLKLREKALEQGYIASYQMLETEPTEEAPFHLMLITTYTDNKQYKHREDNFGKLITERGGVKLLNEKKPGDFRKLIFSKDGARHLE